MKKPGKKEEWMIQQKVDGNLSAQEEKQFNELIRNSAKARRVYQNLASLHQSIKNDSKGIPAIDFSSEIMHRLEGKQNAPTRLPAKTFLFKKTVSPRTMLAYAAILLTGLLAGSVATYMSTGAVHQPAGSTLSGTMAKDDGIEGYYSEKGTEIKIQKVENERFRLLTFSLSTNDTIHVTINCKGDKLEKEQISLLFSEGIFQFAADNDKNLRYRYSGKHIFQITDERLINPLNIIFSRNNEIFYELNPK